MNKDIFRTVRELLESSDCVLMSNTVNTEGKLYDDSVENLTAKYGDDWRDEPTDRDLELEASL